MGHLTIPALWAAWLVLTFGVLVGVARGPHHTPPVPVRHREDSEEWPS